MLPVGRPRSLAALLPLASTLAGSACAGRGGGAGARPDTPPTADARASLAAADSAVGSRVARGAVALATAFEHDGRLLWPGAPVLRRQAAESLLRALPDGAARGLTWRLAHAAVSADGSHGFTYGFGARGGEPSRYLAYWQRNWWSRRSDLPGGWALAAWVVVRGDAPTGPPAPACAGEAARVPGAADYDEVARADAEFSARASRTDKRGGGAGASKGI